MGHRGRMRDETLDAAERLRQREDTDRLNEASNRLGPARKLKAQHGAEAALLDASRCMPRMGRKAGIVDRSNGRVRCQKVRDRLGILLLALDPGKQGSDSAQRLIG